LLSAGAVLCVKHVSINGAMCLVSLGHRTHISTRTQTDLSIVPHT